MKILFLILITLTVIAFGFYIMARVDRFIDETQRTLTDKTRREQSRIRIAAESPYLLDCVAAALESCAVIHPHITLFRSSGQASRLLEKLREERVDIVLLRADRAETLGAQYAARLIPCDGAAFAPSAGRAENAAQLCVVWNKQAASKNRDRVIFALENERCSLKSGYADYLR